MTNPLLLGPRAGEVSVILASGSVHRASILRAAGLDFEVIPADVDEAPVRDSARAAGSSPEQAAVQLAELKALHVSRLLPKALVIGSDQILECDGDWFEKPADRAAAVRQLKQLSGRRHRLLAAVTVYQAGEQLWRHVSVPVLTMRDLDESFIEAYLDAAGPEVFGSVGVYHLEGLGAQLFARIEGDYFSILGLPLLELLIFLRRREIVPG